MARCSGFKPDGTPCERIVGASQEYCFAHDPTKQQARKRNAAKAGASKPAREIAGLKEQLASLYSDVLVGAIEPKVGSVAAQIANVRARVFELEARTREQEEFDRRLARLKAEAPLGAAGRG
jgi:hypothetical protein